MVLSRPSKRAIKAAIANRERIARDFEILPNLDSRNVRNSNVREVHAGGKRLAVKRTHPVAVYAVHVFSGTKETYAMDMLKETRRIVKEHNRKVREGKLKPKHYELLMPKAYPLAPNAEDAKKTKYIIMAKTRAPRIDEVMTNKGRGKGVLKKLESKHGVGFNNFMDAYFEVYLNTGMDSSNILLAGYRNGKFIFVLPADYR